jgi:hypothetical protein
LLLGISTESIAFRDRTAGNLQENPTVPRGDMLFERVTLHAAFRYAVLGGFFFFDAGAGHDATAGRRSNMGPWLWLFRKGGGRTRARTDAIHWRRRSLGIASPRRRPGPTCTELSQAQGDFEKAK